MRSPYSCLELPPRVCEISPRYRFCSSVHRPLIVPLRQGGKDSLSRDETLRESDSSAVFARAPTHARDLRRMEFSLLAGGSRFHTGAMRVVWLPFPFTLPFVDRLCAVVLVLPCRWPQSNFGEAVRH